MFVSIGLVDLYKILKVDLKTLKLTNRKKNVREKVLTKFEIRT